MRASENAGNRGNVRFGSPAKIKYRHQTSGRFAPPARGEDPHIWFRPCPQRPRRLRHPILRSWLAGRQMMG